jgi:hypothetical protein
MTDWPHVCQMYALVVTTLIKTSHDATFLQAHGLMSYHKPEETLSDDVKAMTVMTWDHCVAAAASPHSQALNVNELLNTPDAALASLSLSERDQVSLKMALVHRHLAFIHNRQFRVGAV